MISLAVMKKQSVCNVTTLKGRYLFAAPTILFAPAFGLKDQETAVGNAAGIHVFNGDGTGEDYVTATLNGVEQCFGADEEAAGLAG